LREVELLRAAGKPVVVSMGDVAASGGYWISSRADHILVQPNTITGSIGVFGMFPEISGLLDLVGVNIETVKTGKVADAMSINRPLNPTELEIIQTFIDEIYVAFIERVASGRAMSPEAVREIAQGRVWSGRDAIEIGLADGFGSIDEAAEIAARLAGLGNWSMRLPTVEEPGLVDVVLSSMLEESEDEDLAQLKQTLRVLDYIPRLGSKQGIYAMLPYSLVIK
jgi:protease-4